MRTRFSERWSQFADREKQAIILGTAMILFYIFYQWIFTPALDAVDNLKKNISSNEETLLYMQETDVKIKSFARQIESKNQVTSPVLLLTYLQTKIKTADLQGSLKELKQVSTDSIGLSFEGVSFDKLISFLINVLETHRLTITQMTAKKESMRGKVSADIVLKIQ